jgi:Rrf2 family protein
MTTVQLAEATRVPPFYLAKLMRVLVEAGLISSRRGINGGFQLARDPQVLTLLEVVHAITPSLKINGCPSDSTGTKMCALHRRLGQCQDFVESTLKNSTISDVLNDPDGPQEGRCYGISVNIVAAGVGRA